MNIPFFLSYKSILIFVLILIFQPAEMTFFAIRPSDIWLMFCVYNQYYGGFFSEIHFSKRSFVKNYGFWLGLIALVGTFSQTLYDSTPFEFSFLFHFFRFIRFFLIFKFVENILNFNHQDDLYGFLENYTLLGIILIIFSFLEYYAIQPFNEILINLYYLLPEYTLEEYLLSIERLTGVLGNANATSILLATMMSFPLVSLFAKKNTISKKIIYLVFIILSLILLLVIFGSRTAILGLILSIIVFFVGSKERTRKFLIPIIISSVLFIAGFTLFDNYIQKIELNDRIINLFLAKDDRGEEINYSIQGAAEITGRHALWNDRLDTFNEHGNPLALIFGLGYTKVYKDYSDNGLLGTFINNGLSGLILKFYLYYLLISIGIIQGVQLYRATHNYTFIILVMVICILLLSELTVDIIEHVKLGQLFYLFISLLVLYNAKILDESLDKIDS